MAVLLGRVFQTLVVTPADLDQAKGHLLGSLQGQLADLRVEVARPGRFALSELSQPLLLGFEPHRVRCRRGQRCQLLADGTVRDHEGPHGLPQQVDVAEHRRPLDHMVGKGRL